MRASLSALCVCLLVPVQFGHGNEDNGIFRPRSLFNFLQASETSAEPPYSNDVPSNTLSSSDTNNQHVPLFRYSKKKGRIAFYANNHIKTPASLDTSSGSDDTNVLSISADPFATMRLFQIGYLASKSVVFAFIGTLRLLGPMVFARRVLAQGGELVTDYLMGRYMRTTFDHLERKYWKEYQGPAATRSFCRVLIHGCILVFLGKIMEEMVGLGTSPCVMTLTGACHWWCGLLWVVSVVGAGNFFAALISIRGPVKIKMTKSAIRQQIQQARKRIRRRFPGRSILTKTAKLLKWLRDPDQWLTSIATFNANNNSGEAFTPEPLLFPSTWPPFSIIRNVAIAKAMASAQQQRTMHIIMRQFLIQHALLDEWHRVLMDERRVGLGVASIGIGFITTCFLFVTVALTDNVSAVLLVPSLLATFGSAWMNLFVYWERRRSKGKRMRFPNQSGSHSKDLIKW